MQDQGFTQNWVSAFNECRPIAFTRLYETYRPEVLLRVKGKLRKLPGAEDLVNDIFRKMFKLKGQFETLRNIENYLWSIVRTMCRDYLKKQETPVKNMDYVQEYYQRIENRAIWNVETMETVKAVNYVAMEKLPPKCKEIYILSYIRHMRNKEIAEILGISEKTVENQINIALNKLRKEYKKDGGRMYFIKFLLPLLWDQLVSL
ncbi:MAG TPA: sigma-70 family RNA polymerase sigma factor [Puia sp.]|jgi:RNA polymerase sigma-70 factor (ECF subfamily)|nr:sigma-70 family RNA polymerase sigma factor [Puia sp.]